jgi:chromate transporter
LTEHTRERSSLVEVALLFLRLGATAFGGPAAHTAMMRDEVVTRRKWLTDEEFLDLMSACNFIPGPNSTELAIHIGHRRAGFRGLVVAGACFILPAALITLGFAWLYVHFGRLPQANASLYGVKPVIVAVVVQALWGLGRTAVKTKTLALVGIAAAIATLLGAHELLVLFGAAALYALRRHPREPIDSKAGSLLLTIAPATATLAIPSSAVSIFLVFAKIGSVLFGSGYVLLAFLRSDLVVNRHWLTEGQLLDAVAVGQVTPGPVFTTATFIGFLLGGFSGALAATAGIFLPAFFFVAISGPLVGRLRRSPRAGSFLDGLNVASLALMGVVTLSLARAALVDVWTVLLALAASIVLLRTKINSAWLVLAGVAAGNAIFALR